ncbi:hypothetical protein [Ammoniphilus sp. 3BR4]|uniref:hypothetical protein n=1 Tax=Ammoniphilus sp. 3BR4 TaxID=3158265 RepID=UPI0034665D99
MKRIRTTILALMVIYIIALFSYNTTPIVSVDTAYEIARNNTPLDEGYHVSMMGATRKWSFAFLNHPMYEISVLTVYDKPWEQKEDKWFLLNIDSWTGEVINIEPDKKRHFD